MEREVGGGIGLEYTCEPMAVSFQCMTKFTTNKKKKKINANKLILSNHLTSYSWIVFEGDDKNLFELSFS